jgi:hypothetical protein
MTYEITVTVLLYELKRKALSEEHAGFVHKRSLERYGVRFHFVVKLFLVSTPSTIDQTLNLNQGMFEYKRTLEISSVVEGRLIKELTTSSLVQLKPLYPSCRRRKSQT